MKGNRAWVLAGAALAAGVGVAFYLSERHPKLSEESRVLVVGDSMAEGLTPFLRTLSEEAGLPFMALHARGSTITDWAGLVPTDLSAALDAALVDFEPTVVIVVLGTNDEYLSQASLDAEADDIEALLGKLEDLGLDVAWVGVPPLPKPESNGAVELIAETGVAVFPTENVDIPRAPDRLHPSVAGYGKWAGGLWSWLS